MADIALRMQLTKAEAETLLKTISGGVDLSREVADSYRRGCDADFRAELLNRVRAAEKIYAAVKLAIDGAKA